MRSDACESVQAFGAGDAVGARDCVLGGLVGSRPRRREDAAPLVSPDRIDDVPSTKPDPFPAFDNFAWRAFVALNWPSLSDAAHRGEPDRAKALGDPGPRVWETFKSRYELFQVGPDGQAGRARSLGELRRPQPLRSRRRQPREDAGVFRSLCGLQPARLHAGRVPQSARRAEPDLYALRDPDQRARIRRHRRQRLERAKQPAGRGASGRPADRVDCGQGVVAPADRCGYAGRSGALLRRQGRRGRRRREEPRGRPHRLLEKRYRRSSGSTS